MLEHPNETHTVCLCKATQKLNGVFSVRGFWSRVEMMEDIEETPKLDPVLHFSSFFA